MQQLDFARDNLEITPIPEALLKRTNWWGARLSRQTQ
jgi:hypothetical protein